MVGDVLRALPSFSGEATKHSLTSTVFCRKHRSQLEGQQAGKSGETTRYLEPDMIMIIIEGQFPEKICIVSICHLME